MEAEQERNEKSASGSVNIEEGEEERKAENLQCLLEPTSALASANEIA